MIIKYTLRANPEAYEAGVDDSVCTILDGVRGVTSQLDKDGNRYICAVFRDANTPDAILPIVSPIYIMNDNGKTIEVVTPSKL